MLYCTLDDKVNIADDLIKLYAAAADSKMHPRCKKLVECMRQHNGGQLTTTDFPQRETLSEFSGIPMDELDAYLLALSVWMAEYIDELEGRG